MDISLLTWILGGITTLLLGIITWTNRRVELTENRVNTMQLEMDRVATLEAHRIDSDRRTSVLEANVTQISAQFASMQASIAKQEVMLQLLLTGQDRRIGGGS